jgi:hypothetical protein
MIICVGTGRDGTLSIAEMFQDVFDRAGRGQRVMHEYQAREFYEAFCNYRETSESRYLAEIRQMIAECSYDCIVGNGYAPVLPLFAEHWGRGATLVHIRRTDRNACIASLEKNAVLFPRAYRYYAASGDAETKRMAAFHFDEMSEAEWSRCALREKLAWYYDKTHALISSHHGAFAQCCEITTESINRDATRQLIARLATGDDTNLPPPTWLNAYGFDIAALPADRRAKMQWLIGRMDIGKMAHDEVYAIGYFLEKFVAWTGYQIDGSIAHISRDDVRSTAEMHAILDIAHRVVSDRLKDIEALRSAVDKPQRGIRRQDRQ